jgi:hypothetical protein
MTYVTCPIMRYHPTVVAQQAATVQLSSDGRFTLGAHDQFRWFGGGWKVNAELPGPAGFAAATRYVRPEDVADSISCGPDTAQHVKALRPWVEAGFSHVALVQIGGESQPEFLEYAHDELLPALRQEYGEGPEDWLAAA